MSALKKGSCNRKMAGDNTIESSPLVRLEGFEVMPEALEVPSSPAQELLKKRQRMRLSIDNQRAGWMSLTLKVPNLGR